MKKGSHKVKFNVNEIKKLIRQGNSLSKIAQNMGIHRLTLSSYLNQFGINKESIKFNHNFFENIDCENKAYWLGFIMADGCVITNPDSKVVIKLKNEDYNHLKKWHQSINSCLNVHKMKSGSQSAHYSKKMCNDLIKLGCIPRKSNNLRFPKIKKELLNHFIRGYFDGDGCIEIRKSGQLRLSFIGTESFLKSLSSIIQINNKLQPIGNNKKARSLSIHGNKKAGKIAKWMYENSNIFLERKKKVYYSHL